MMDTIRFRQYRFRVLTTDDFYCTTTDGKTLPRIDTLTNLKCYSTIPSDMNFQAYRLKSVIKTNYGYTPALIEIRDIPFTWKRFHIVIEIALPKVLYGQNLNEIYEHQWEEIIQAIYTMLLQFGIQISIDELRDTPHISRIDFCKNIVIRSSVEDFIALLQKLKKQRSRTYSKYDTTVSYGTKKKRLVIYDKIKEVICNASSDESATTYKLAKLLITLQEVSDIHVIRVEQRLYGRQTIVRELKPLFNSEDITFKSLFSQKVASYILTKHWAKVTHEEKFKLLLLGEKDLHIVLAEISKAARQQPKKNVNPLSILYSKLLFDIGEEATIKDIKSIRSARSLDNYRKSLYELVRLLPMYDTRLADYVTITKAITDWETFSLPVIPS